MNRYAKALIGLGGAVLLTGCGGGDGIGTDAPTAEGGLGVPSGVYALDRTHAYVSFSYLHQGLSYPLLRATSLDGELELDAVDIGNSKVNVAIEADSIRTNTPYFDKELASPKFFNAGKYPHITFTTERYEAATESTGELHGLVTIRGISKPLSLAVTINGAMVNPITKKPVVGVSAKGSLQRSDFDLDRFIPAVADRVDISIEAEFAAGSSENSAAAAALARGLPAGGSTSH